MEYRFDKFMSNEVQFSQVYYWCLLESFPDSSGHIYFFHGIWEWLFKERCVVEIIIFSVQKTSFEFIQNRFHLLTQIPKAIVLKKASMFSLVYLIWCCCCCCWSLFHSYTWIWNFNHVSIMSLYICSEAATASVL